MKRLVFIFSLIVSSLVFCNGCVTINNISSFISGMVKQKSTYHRLHLSFGKEGFRFKGVEIVKSVRPFHLENNPPAVERISDYYIAVLKDNKGNILHEGLVFGVYFQDSKKTPAYWV